MVKEIIPAKAEEFLKELPRACAGLIIADCHLDMGWAKLANDILVPSGFILLSINKDMIAAPLFNFISYKIGIIGGIIDIYDPIMERKWMVMQKYPSSTTYFGVKGITAIRKTPDNCCLCDSQLSTLMLAYLIDTFSYKNFLVVDICAGSGSVAVACAKVGRFYAGCDHDINMVGKANIRLFGRHYKCV